jgi:hypothetical protein
MGLSKRKSNPRDRKRLRKGLEENESWTLFL